MRSELALLFALVGASAIACSAGVGESPAAEEAASKAAAESGPVIDARVLISRAVALPTPQPEAAELVAGESVAGELIAEGLAGDLVAPESALPEAADVPGASAASEAIAHFALSQSTRTSTLAAAGLEAEIPAIGQCLDPGAVVPGAFSALGEVRFLDVGEVSLQPLATVEGAEPPILSLAPHAFPSISSFVSGVVYTSRDRVAAALPSGVNYRLKVAGGSDLPGFVREARAPEELSQITLGGEPFERVRRVSTQAPLDVTWAVGSPGDVVVIDLANADDTSAIVRCAFADEQGVGSVAADWLSGLSGAGRVALHRRRVEQGPLPSAAPANGRQDESGNLLRVSFDLEVARQVDFAIGGANDGSAAFEVAP